MSRCRCRNVLSGRRSKSSVTVLLLVLLILSSVIYPVLVERVGLVLWVHRLVAEVTDRTRLAKRLLVEGDVGCSADLGRVVVQLNVGSSRGIAKEGRSWAIEGSWAVGNEGRTRRSVWNWAWAGVDWTWAGIDRSWTGVNWTRWFGVDKVGSSRSIVWRWWPVGKWGWSMRWTVDCGGRRV